MSGERSVTKPLVARKEGGDRLALVLIDAGRNVHVLGPDDCGRIVLSYNGHRLLADERDIGARTVPASAAAAEIS